MKPAPPIRICLCLALLALAPEIRAQQLSFARIDSLSYQAYLQNDWKKVIGYAKTGFKLGYDYYYLRMRAGIARFNRNQMTLANKQFRKALAFNQNDPVALEYLYASLLRSGDLAESRLLAANHSPAFREKLGVPAHRLITSAFVEPGYFFNPKAAELAGYRPDAQVSYVYLVPSYSYLSAGINLETGKRFSATLSTNLISYKASQQFLIRNMDAITRDVPFNQSGLYLAGNYYLGKGFDLTLAGQYLWATVPLYHWEAGSTGGSYVLDALAYQDLALHFSAGKRVGRFYAGLTADANRFRGTWYRQAGLQALVYPAGNTDTYLDARADWVSDSLATGGHTVSRLTAGRKLFRNVWAEGYYYLGDIRNFSESSAYVVFNNYDRITRRWGVNLLAYSLLPHLDLSLRYQHSRRSANFLIYQDSEYIGNELRDYPVDSFIIGLTWRF
jgi:hypothetical protein